MNILIIGAGDIGFHLTKKLSSDNHNITIIENSSSKANHAKEHLDAQIIEGSGTSILTLKNASANKADIVAALTNNDEANIIASQIAKKLGAPTTIARIRNPEYSDNNFILPQDFGIDLLIQPEKLTSNTIVQLIKQSNATDFVDFDEGKIQLIGIRLDNNSSVLNTPFKELGQKFGDYPLRILAIKRRQQTIIPRGEDILLNGDQIYIICDKALTPDALKLFGKSETIVNNIMIIGGGLVGQFIAGELEKEINVKIIETDEIKSHLLADKLKRSLVINGDGSDLDLLINEGLMEMDEFIAVTGNDETNFITSLVARHLKVPRAITLVRKMEYLPLTHAIGVDTVISKQYITVNAIQKFIRQRQVALFAELPGIDAEIIEFIANANSKIIKKPLREINFPKNAIVGAVLKNGDYLEIPTGSTHIAPGDRVVVFTMPESLKEIEKLF